MIYCDFQGKKLSQLGFGAMRLPVCENGDVDTEKLIVNKNGIHTAIITAEDCHVNIVIVYSEIECST